MENTSQGRVLVVEDETALRRAFARMLEDTGFAVVQAGDGQQAIDALAGGAFEVILTDIAMPGMDGIQLLRAVRERDLDVPVILISGNPTVESAVQAVQYGALQYLIKPVDSRSLIAVVEKAAKLGRIAVLKREAASLGPVDKLLGDRVAMETSFARGLDTLWMAFQPIVDWREKRIVAFEALVRTNEPTLPHPGVLFAVAERLDRVHEIGRTIRGAIAKTLFESPPPAEVDVFINLHPGDFLDETLFSPDAPLAAFASRVVLEVTERAALDEKAGIAERVGRLRKLGYRIAIDDLGAGYAGLSYFTQLTPDVVKIDMSLVRNIHEDPVKQKLVGSLTQLCKELGMRVVAEGIETAAERDTCVELGCDLLQGYLFAKPGRPYPEVTW
ncbi:MAG: EAL domain-containing protein [Proteobacteria bacterium]|jgi:EAL domain-containing protein (putative c-di-GMP-specific phosphodiesterase class I)/CheY-like chemotaxis protein|nr:EAL domain-containing protein [Pseudomonadota bacterium]